MFNLYSYLKELWKIICLYKEITDWQESLICNKDLHLSFYRQHIYQQCLFFFSLSSLNFENQQINSKALFWITVCISINNENYFMNKIIIKEAWNAFFLKYKKKLQTTERQYFTEFVEYKISLNITVNEIWT